MYTSYDDKKIQDAEENEELVTLNKEKRKLSRMYVKGADKHSTRYYKQKKRVALLKEKVRRINNAKEKVKIAAIRITINRLLFLKSYLFTKRIKADSVPTTPGSSNIE